MVSQCDLRCRRSPESFPLVGYTPDPAARIIGDKEKKSAALSFDFLGLYRPSVILGNSNTPSALGLVMPLVHWAMPSRFHSIHKNDLARAMVAQSEQAFFALARRSGPAGRPRTHKEFIE